jgi:mono/diheme cytochrome c family protein
VKRLFYVAGTVAFVTLIAIAAGSVTLAQAPAAAAATAPAVTFHKDIEPILQKNCQSCHRPGQIAPMSLLSYQAVRPWARAIKTKVVAREMPPWFADPHAGPQYTTDRSMQQSDIDLFANWADSGAPEGDA